MKDDRVLEILEERAYSYEMAMGNMKDIGEYVQADRCLQMIEEIEYIEQLIKEG